LKCNKEWEELLVKTTDKEPEVCPECGTNKIKKLPPRNTGFKFNCLGTYTTDYAHKAENNIRRFRGKKAENDYRKRHKIK